MGENKLKSAIIGCGQIAGGYDEYAKDDQIRTHAKAYQQQQATKLVAVVDRDHRRAKKFSAYWGVPETYADAAKMLSTVKPDIVSICTPDNAHEEMLELCLNHPSIKAVWCEKPLATLATKIGRAETIVSNYAKKGLVLAVNYQRRWDIGMQRVKKAVQEHELGRIQKVVVYYTKGICNNGSHAIDLFLDWFGEPSEMRVFGCHADFSSDDPTVDACLRFGETEVFLLGVDAREYSIFEIDILGSSGRVRVKDSGRKIEWFRREPSPNFKGYLELSLSDVEVRPGHSQPMLEALKEVVSSVVNGTKVRSDGRSALATLKVCHELVEQTVGK